MPPPSAASESPFDVDPATMRRMAGLVVEALVGRHADLDGQPAWRGATRAEMRARLPGAAPEAPSPFADVLEHVLRDVLDRAGRIDHPRFMAFVPSSPVWPAVLGELLTAGYNVFGGTWLASAGPSALELEVLGWFKSWIGYPPEAAGLLTSGGSMANLLALACARLTRFGAHEPRAVIYSSTEAHSSVMRAARILGFADEAVRRVATDEGLRVRADALEAAVREDRAAGLEPFLVVANAGATSTGAIDPLPALRAVADRERLWLHADAAYGGFASLTERGRELLGGLGDADSVTLDPHKWLFQPYEAGSLMVRAGHRLADAFHVMPDYLQDTAVRAGTLADEAEVNFADRGVQLTRATRAVKIYLSVRCFGLAAFRSEIERAMELADRAERWIRESDTLELVSPAQLGIVCFRHRAGSVAIASEEAATDLGRRRLRELAESGRGMISSTRVHGRYALRLCIMNHRTGWADVETVLEELARGAAPAPDGAANEQE